MQMVRAMKPLAAERPPTAATRTEKTEAPKQSIAQTAKPNPVSETPPPPPPKGPAMVTRPAKTRATEPHCPGVSRSL